MGTSIVSFRNIPKNLTDLLVVAHRRFSPSICLLTRWYVCYEQYYRCYVANSETRFSKLGALPFARFLYHIDKRTNTPVNCVWASAFSAGLLALICLAGPAASGAIFTLGVVCQYASLSIPIAARHLGGKEFTPGPFHLGKCVSIIPMILSAGLVYDAYSSQGKPVAAVAVTWMTFMAIVLLFPSVPEADTQTMNYTVVVLGGVLMLSLAYYYFPVYGGAYWFAGPVSTVVRDVDDARRLDSSGSCLESIEK